MNENVRDALVEMKVIKPSMNDELKREVYYELDKLLSDYTIIKGPYVLKKKDDSAVPFECGKIIYESLLEKDGIIYVLVSGKENNTDTTYFYKRSSNVSLESKSESFALYTSDTFFTLLNGLMIDGSYGTRLSLVGYDDEAKRVSGGISYGRMSPESARKLLDRYTELSFRYPKENLNLIVNNKYGELSGFFPRGEINRYLVISRPISNRPITNIIDHDLNSDEAIIGESDSGSKTIFETADENINARINKDLPLVMKKKQE